MFNNPKQSHAEQIILPTKPEQIKKLEKEVVSLDEAMDVFSKQLVDLKTSLADMDEIQKEQVNEILQQLPAGASPQSVLDKILKIATPKRTQLLDSIQKVTVSIEIEEGRKRKILIEKRKIEAEIREEGLNELARRVCDQLKIVLDQYLEFEDSLLKFKEKTIKLGSLDSRYYNRVDINKYPAYFIEMLGMTCCSPSSLPELSPTNFILNFQNLAPGVNPLGNPERQHMRQDRTNNIIANL